MISLYNWNDNTFPNYPSTYCEFENSLCQNSLIQLITFPTRNNNLLDLLLTNNPMIISKINELLDLVNILVTIYHFHFLYLSKLI